MLSSSPTRTLPPTSAASATYGSCMRPIEKAEKTAPGGSRPTRASSVVGSFGAPLLDVREPLVRADHVRAHLVDRQRRGGAAEHEVAAHAGGQVEDNVDVRRADALDDLAVQRRVARAAAGLGIADVDVRDR